MRLFPRLAVCAVAATLAGVSAGDGRGVRAATGDGGAETAAVIVKSVKPQKPSDSGLVDYGLTRSDYRRIVATISGIRRAIPVRETTGMALHRDQMADVRLIGTTEAFAGAHGLEVARGRFLTEKDLQQRENVAVITRETARRFFLDEDPIGKNIRFERNYFLIVGVVSKANALPSANDSTRRADADLRVFIPLSTMRLRLGDRAVSMREGFLDAVQYEFSWIEIVVEDSVNIEATADAIRHILQASHEQADYSVEIVRQSAGR